METIVKFDMPNSPMNLVIRKGDIAEVDEDGWGCHYVPLDDASAEEFTVRREIRNAYMIREEMPGCLDRTNAAVEKDLMVAFEEYKTRLPLEDDEVFETVEKIECKIREDLIGEDLIGEDLTVT